MRRSRKVALGLVAGAVLVGGGMAAGVPALAQTDPAEPGSSTECPVECPFDRDQNRDRDQMRDRMREHMGTVWPGLEYQQGHEHRQGPGDGTCWAEPDSTADGS